MSSPLSAQTLSLGLHTGDRAELLPSFRMADNSEAALAAYYQLGEVLVLRSDSSVVGHVQLIAAEAADTLELKNVAVAPQLRGAGWGRRLMSAAFEHARKRGARRLLLSTATCETRLLRFYQQLGFRMLRIDRDVFTAEAGYPPGLESDGIPLLDRVWFDLSL